MAAHMPERARSRSRSSGRGDPRRPDPALRFVRCGDCGWWRAHPLPPGTDLNERATPKCDSCVQVAAIESILANEWLTDQELEATSSILTGLRLYLEMNTARRMGWEPR